MWRLVNPFEAAVALAAFLSGIRGLLSGAQSNSVLSELWPGALLTLYLVVLALGGLAILLGAALSLRRRTKSRRQLWQTGLLAVGFAWTIYGGAILLFTTAAGISGVLLGIVGVAALIRCWQLNRTE